MLWTKQFQETRCMPATDLSTPFLKKGIYLHQQIAVILFFSLRNLKPPAFYYFYNFNTSLYFSAVVMKGFNSSRKLF